MKRIFLLIILFYGSNTLSAQTLHSVSGVVKDSTGQEIIAANIWLITGRDSIHTTSNETGRFSFNNVQHTAFTIRISILGYVTLYKAYRFTAASSRIELPPLILEMSTSNLQEIVVKGRPAPVVVKEDTMEFRADQYRLRENAVAEELLKRLPGIDVDKDGNVQAMGKKITKVRVNGKDFLVSDLKSLTRLLPVNMIDKIQLIDDYGDMARATGRKEGEPERILNIQTREDLSQGFQGQGIAGAGNDGRYNAAVLANFFNGKQQISLNGNSNNISAPAGNVTSTTGNINYRDQPGKALSVEASIMAVHNTSSIQSSSAAETVTSEGTLNTASSSTNNSVNSNYALNGRVEYKPDNGDIVNFNLSMNINNTDNSSLQTAAQSGFQRKDQVTANNTVNRVPSVGAGFFATHNFKKKGRIFSSGLFVNYNDNVNDQDVSDRVQYYSDDNTLAKDSLLRQIVQKGNNNLVANVQLSYIEPFDSTASLELKYMLNYNLFGNKQETQWVDLDGHKQYMPSLSNDFTYKTVVQQIEVNYRKIAGRFEYNLGARLQPALLSGDGVAGQPATKVSSSSIVPVLRLQYKLPRSQYLSLFYSGNIIFPTFQQLQPVPDMSNAQFPVIGNPDLSAGFMHSVFFNYRNFDVSRSNTLYIHFAANYMRDKVVTNVVLVPDSFNTVKQETRFLNTNGNYDLRGVYGWSHRFSDGKYNAFLDGSATYNNNVLYMQDERNVAKNLVLTQSARGSMLQDWLEMTAGVSYTYNRNAYMLPENSITNFSTWMLSVSGKFYFLKTFALGGDANKQLNSGYSGAVAVNPLIMNAFLEKMFFKRKLTARIQVFNLLNETSRLSQSVTGNTVTEMSDNLISRYFMLSLQYDFRKFKTAK